MASYGEMVRRAGGTWTRANTGHSADDTITLTPDQLVRLHSEMLMVAAAFQYTVQRVIGARQDFIAGFNSSGDAENFAEFKHGREEGAATYYVWHEHGNNTASVVRTFYRVEAA
jgi:hypothetical protein